MNMDPVETHRSFVNTWECDENAHMNVQFYWKRFDEAARIFKLKSGQETQSEYEPWRDRHVLYLGELHSGTTTVVHSRQEGGYLVHMLSNEEDGSQSASAFEQCGDSVNIAELPDTVRPRSLPVAPLEVCDAGAKIANGRGLVTHMGVVNPVECDCEGNLLDQHHISRLSDAAAHLWSFVGVKRSWMGENNLGSAAVEMKVTRHCPVVVGTHVEITSWVEEIREKTFSFRHQVQDMKTGKALYSSAVTALMMDLEKRKAVPIPQLPSLAAFR